MKLFNDLRSHAKQHGNTLGAVAAIGFACCVLLGTASAQQPSDIPASLQEKVEERKRLRERERLMFPEKYETDSPAETYNTKDAGTFSFSRYYTPVEGQEFYLNGFKPGKEGDCSTYANLTWRQGKGDFRAEKCMNGDGDHFITKDGTDLRNAAPFTVLACDPAMLGRTFIIDALEGKIATCRDTGGAIKGNRIDLWVGLGQDGYNNYFALEPLMKASGGQFTLREVL